MTTTEKVIIKELVKANNENRLAVFIGAGISKSASNEFPNWEQLINELKKELKLSCSENDFLKIAQLYYMNNKKSYYKNIENFFPKNVDPSEVHKLIFEIKPQCIITTNWDTLLEDAMNDSTSLYSVIASDKELIKPDNLQRKIIKMHGDFKHKNIIFTDDDYLKYSDNFPLIENYVKTVLATYTVLFLGYSYNDINLKYINKWLQKNSKNDDKSNKYLVTFDKDKMQEKYLKNHDITTLSLNETKVSLYSKQTATFLGKLANFEERYDFTKDDDILNYIYDKLELLDKLNVILWSQIEECLNNKTVRDDTYHIYYENNKIIFVCNSNYRPTNFITVLKKEYNNGKSYSELCKKIFVILIKAGIDSILFYNGTTPVVYSDGTTSNLGNKEYIELHTAVEKKLAKNNVDDYLNFEFYKIPAPSENTPASAYYFYQKTLGTLFDETVPAPHEKIINELIKKFYKDGNYVQSYLAEFNKSFSFFYTRRENFSRIEIDRTTEKLFNLETKLAELNLESYQYLSQVENEINGKRYLNGGFSYEKNYFFEKHKNIVLFFLKNYIMVDERSDYRSINFNYLKIATLTENENNQVPLNKIQLYACIKFVKYETLRYLFKFEDSQNTSIKFKRLFISEDDKTWLIEKVLPNLLDICILRRQRDNYLDTVLNTIFLLALVNIKPEQINTVLNLFLDIISNKQIYDLIIGIFDIIIIFLDYQRDALDPNINKENLLNLLEVVISKIGKNEIHILQIWNIINIIVIFANYAKGKIIFDNEILISKMLIDLKTIELNDSTRIANLLSAIYIISTAKIQGEIEQFIVQLEVENKLEEYAMCCLMLINLSQKKLENKLITTIERYIDECKEYQSYDVTLYNLKNYSEAFVEKYSEFQPILDKINNLVKEDKKLDDFFIRLKNK